LAGTPGVSPGLQLQPPETATTVRVQDGKTLTTDGPFAETKEALGGYLLFEADRPDPSPIVQSTPKGRPARRVGPQCGEEAPQRRSADDQAGLVSASWDSRPLITCRSTEPGANTLIEY